MTLDVSSVRDVSGGTVRHTDDPNAYCSWGVDHMGAFDRCGDRAVFYIQRPDRRAFAPTHMYFCSRHGSIFEDVAYAAHKAARG